MYSIVHHHKGPDAVVSSPKPKASEHRARAEAAAAG